MKKKIFNFLYKYKLIIYLGLQAIRIQLYKLYISDLLARIFTKINFSKIIIIFTVGLISRIFIGFYYDINVFIEYYKSISLIYYSVMAIFIVTLGELFNYFNLSIIPSFIFDYYNVINEGFSRLSSNLKRIYISLKQVNNNINCLKISDFTLKSINSYLSLLSKIVKNIFTMDYNKFIIGKIKEEEDNFDCLNKYDILKISNIIHKGKDKHFLPKTTYKPGSTSVATPLQQISEASTSIKSGMTAPFVLSTDDNNLRENTRLSSSNIRDQLHSSSVYSDNLSRQSNRSEINYGNFPLYQESINSDFATPKTMTPLFGNSSRDNSLRASIKNNGSNISKNNSLLPSTLASPSNYPAPLTLSYDKQGDKISISFNRNSRLSTPSFDSSSTYSRNVSAMNYRPYDLSGNGVLPNFTFNQVSGKSTSIPLDYRGYNNHTLPIIPSNYDSNLDDIANSSYVNDPCSIHYISKHRHQYVNETKKFGNSYYNPDIVQTSQEVVVKKPGLVGKVKLGFKTLGDKFNNGINKIESVYIKYETIGKRHIIWNLFEENNGLYESYEDFKKDWDSKASLWKEIKDRTKKDLKREIEDLLGIRGNKPAIKSNIHKEIEDVLHTKRPFVRSVNNTPTYENNSNVINAQEESNNILIKDKGKGKDIYKDDDHYSKSRSYRHSHHHKHHRSKRT